MLLQEWVRDIGGQAGVTQFNARISSGAVGVPESRLEVGHLLDYTRPIMMDCTARQ